MKTMKGNIVLALCAVIAGLPVEAQQTGWERSLTIEGQYNPNTGKENKLAPAPERRQTASSQTVKVDFLTQEPEQADFGHRSMNVLSESSNAPAYPSFDGFASFGYGLQNTAEGSVGLIWRLSPRDRLEFNAGLDQYNSKTLDWRQRLAGTQAGLSYTHSFDRFDIGASGSLDYSFRNFRRAYIGRIAGIGDDSLKQRSLYGFYEISARSKADSKIQWTFGFSQEGLERRGLTIYDCTPNNDETVFRVAASASMPFDFGNISIGYRQKSVNRNWSGMYGYVYDDFSTFTFTPEWSTSIGEVKTSFGVNFDFRSAMGETFMMSPEVSAEYDIDSQFSVWGRLDGGLEEHSMYSLSSVSPYWSEYRPIRDGYTLARLEGGIRYTLPSVLSAGARLGIRYTKDELFQIADTKGIIVTSELLQDNACVIWSGFDVAWAMSGRFDAKATLELYGWTDIYDSYLLAYKPAAVARLFGHANVYPGIDLSVQYNWQRFAMSQGERLNAINELELRADWQILDNLSVYMKAANLLGHNFEYWAGYRALKPYALLGATVKF